MTEEQPDAPPTGPAPETAAGAPVPVGAHKTPEQERAEQRAMVEAGQIKASVACGEEIAASLKRHGMMLDITPPSLRVEPDGSVRVMNGRLIRRPNPEAW